MSSTAEQHASNRGLDTGISRLEARGRAVGSAVLASFGLLWAIWGTTGGVPRGVAIAVAVAAGLCTLALLVGVVAAFRRSYSLPPGPAELRDVKAGKRFGLVTAVEFVGIFASAWVLAATGHRELVPAVACLGVGLHFFPLSRLFKIPLYAGLGAALCLIALLAAVAAPLTGRPALWTILPGFGAALALYLTGAFLLRATLVAGGRGPV